MSATDAATGLSGQLSAWLSPRRKRFWAIVAIVAYTFGGFFLAPWLARSQLVELVGDRLERPVSLEELRFNPYVLSAEARNFRIDETDGSPVLGFERLYVNFQLSSIVRRALVFREVRLVAPHAAIVRDEESAINLVELFAASANGDGPIDEEKVEDSGLPPVVVQDLAISAGVVDLRDRALPTDFETQLGPVDIAVANLSTQPDESGEQQVSITSEGGTKFAWSGSLQITPLLSQGRVTVTGPYLPLVYRYFQDQLNFSISNGEVEMEFAYRVALPPNDVLAVSIDDVSAQLTGITAHADDRDTEFLRLPATRLEGGHFHWPERRVGAGLLEFNAAALELWRDADGELIFSQLLAGSPSPEEPPAESESGPAWDLRFDALRIADMRVGFTDDALVETGRLEVTDLDLAIDNLSNEPGAEFPTSLDLALGDYGTLGIDGTLAAIPAIRARGKLTLSGLALALANPWINNTALVAVRDGRLNTELEATFEPATQLTITGSMNVLDLDVNDTSQEEKLIGWDRLEVDRFHFAGQSNALEISEIVVHSPYARLLIAADGATNFTSVIRADASAAEPARSDPQALDLTIGQFRIDSGAVNFTDLALPFPFEAQVRELHGGISTLATTSSEPATIDLEGKVDEYGFARIEGTVLPADATAATDIHVLFRNVEFPDLSPYTIKFAGRRIDDGRLEVELNYRVDDGELDAQNSIVIDRIALGEKVDYPDAMNLPLGLAVALLQDPSGRINIDLPVGGNVNDPEFSVGGVVFRAFVNLITKAATSPFRLLGGLVGADSETFDQIEFEPGQSDLTPPEREKLSQLASALAMRPTLNLMVPGVVDPDTDAFALRTAAIDTRIETSLDADPAAADSAMIAERRRKAIETLYREAFPDERLRDLRPQFAAPVDPEKPDGETAFDELAYVSHLRDRLIVAEDIGREDLETLADARADSIVQTLTGAEEPLAAERVRREETTDAQPNERGFIPLKLELGK